MAEEDKPIEVDETGSQIAEPAAEPEHHKVVAQADSSSHLQRFKTWYGEHKKWTIPGSVLLVILVLAAVPFTRNNLAGLVIKRDLSVKVVDATAGTPVSGVSVSVSGLSGLTDGTGKATIHKLKPGHHVVVLTKKYYKDQQANVSVSVLGSSQTPTVQMTATGRLVKLTVTNSINKAVLSAVSIKVADTTAKTDKNGSATIVLPAGTMDQKATLSLSGYNDTAVTIKVSNDKIQDNNFTMTPAGKVYFLSKLSGKIDVVKTNLDGTNRQTVLAGTGNEQDTTTVLLASRDWKYLALLSRRAGTSDTLYLIDTSDDSLTTMDEGSASYTLNGWVGDSFVYTVTRDSVQLWQANRQSIKSFDAPTKKLTVLDQTTASGTGQSDYVTQLVGPVYVYNDQVFYIMNWTAAYSGASSTELATKQATFNSVKPDGSGKKAIKSFGLAAGTTAIDITLEERVESPSQIDLKFSDGTKDNFYTYADGQVKDQPNGSSDTFYSATYPTYVQSPTGNNTFWSEPRDGKNTLFVGDEDGQNAKQIATLSDYDVYGWYTDDYLLVSKDASELYIMPKGGSSTSIKISDYHKPALTYNGYGGGYGGL